MRKLDPVLHEKILTLIKSMGYEFVGGEMITQNRQTVLRIYLDGPTGVNVDDCSKVSRQIGAMMDVDDPLQTHYNLEVSSPGIDRPLFELEHYQRFIGKQVRIKLHVAVSNRRQFKGTLLKVEGENIHLQAEDVEQEVVLPFSAIDKANLIGDVKF